MEYYLRAGENGLTHGVFRRQLWNSNCWWLNLLPWANLSHQTSKCFVRNLIRSTKMLLELVSHWN